MDPEIRATIEAQLLKKKPPKLKTGDRTMSLAIDNYSPGSAQSAVLAIDPTLLTSDNVIVSPVNIQKSSPPIASASTIQELKKTNIFYMENSSSSLNNYTDYPHPHSHHLPRKPSIRRSDTLDVYGTGLFEMRKTHSFNSNEATVEDILMARRTNSMRHTTASNYPHEFDVVDDDAPLPPPAPPIVTTDSTTRRNCRMHKSFHERRHEPKREQIIETVKCHSLGDDGSDDNLNGAKRKLSPKFNSANSSLENEVFHSHSRSNSRNKIETEPSSIDAIEIATASTPALQTKIKSASHKHSSHSLDKPHHNFRRIARATQSFYLNPNQFEELRLQRAMHGTSSTAATGKRMHSASMRTKPFRETLGETKKSKSFITDPFAEYDHKSPHRRDSKLFSGDPSVADVKKSPRLSSNLMLPDTMRTSYDSRKSSNFDGNDLDYDVIMRAYRQNRRKSSILSGTGGKKTKSSSKKKSIDDGGVGPGDVDEDADAESTRKRKKIVCIIITVFLSLVFASIFVVVFTLTHSTVTQVQDQTRRVYTFAPGPVGSRDSPLHHYNANTNNGN